MFSGKTSVLFCAALFLLTPLVLRPVQAAELTQCAICHTDDELMDELTEEAIMFGEDEDEISPMQHGKGYGVKKAPFDLYEKMLVDEDFLQSTHGQIPCHLCHKGNPDSDDPAVAHEGLLSDPSLDSETTCGQCHADISDNGNDSLHMKPGPLYATLDKRCSADQLSKLNDSILDRQCLSCHQGSCGSCHISRPDVVGGGLQKGHFFNKKPDFVYNCLPCHTAPTGNDFIGKKGSGDIHYRKYNMTCTSCHGGEELHAAAKEGDNRYHFSEKAECIDCHEAVSDDPIPEHVLHKNVSCAVCHAAPYQNCNSCHIGTDKDGVVYSQSSPSFKSLKIGLNPDKDGPRFVLLREVAVQRDTFKNTIGKMQNYSALPTYKRASPHTIQRRTWQSADCNHCHGNKELFLTQDSMPFDMIVTNRHVALKASDVPGPVQAKRSFILSPTHPDPAMRVSADWLKKHRKDKNFIILDTRTRDQYEKGHIPGAYHICFCLFRTAAESAPPYMMQTAEELAKIFGGPRLGLTPKKRVVIYDDGHSGRGIAFLALQIIGHNNISFLDGTIDSWKKKGYKLAKGRAPQAKVKKYPLTTTPDLLVNNQDIIRLMGTGQAIVVDTRNAAQHNGDIVRTDIAKKGGAIPESISFPLQTLRNSKGELYSTKRLAWLLSNAGISSASTGRTIITTCNTNMLAAELYMVLEYLGYEDVKIHDGSWAEWAAEFE